jgi:hypothetical protein
MQMFRRRHRAGRTQFRNLFLRKIAGWSAHRVERLQNIPVIVINPPERNAHTGWHILHIEVKGS